MSLATLAGADVLSGLVEMPARGLWTADVRIASEDVPVGAVTLAFAGGLSLSGTVHRAAPDGRGAVEVYIVAGAGGLGGAVTGHYRRGKARDILGAILRTTGERQAPDIDAGLLAESWALYSLAGTGRSALHALSSALSARTGSVVTWRSLPGGEIWIGVDPWPTVALDASQAVVAQEPALGIATLAVETPTIAPGVEVEDVGRCYFVRHVIEPDRVRTEILTREEPSTAAVRGLLGLRDPDGQRPGDPAQPWRYGLQLARVDARAADGSTVDVTPEDPRLSPMQAVPLRPPFPGAVVVCAVGAYVLLGWERGDETRVYALPVWGSGSAEKVVIDASSVYLGAESGAEKGAKGQTLKTYLESFKAAFDVHGHLVTGVQAGAASVTTAAPAPSPAVPDVRADRVWVR